MSSDDRPAAEGLDPGHYPSSPVEVNHTAPVPRRIRAVYDGQTIIDTVRATYVWEHPYYPQYYIPEADVDASLLSDDGTPTDTKQGRASLRTLHHRDREDVHTARYLREPLIEGLGPRYRFDFDVMDAWFEEDEEVFLHPRSPYVRVDALRSSRHVRVEAAGIVLAESTSPVAVFETGLPTRWYLDRTDVNWQHLVQSDTRSQCPYKGITSDYWSVRTNGPAPDDDSHADTSYDDIAWGYDFPTRQLTPVTGLVAFYNEKLDIFLDGVPE